MPNKERRTDQCVSLFGMLRLKDKLYADLIHEQRKAGIMLTHDLHMCRYVDKIIQIRDGKIETVIEDRNQINHLIH